MSDKHQTKPSNFSQSRQKLKEIFEGVKVEDGYMDPYSIRSSLISDIVQAKIYNEVVDWSCIFNTLFDVFRSYKNEEHMVSLPDAEAVKELTLRAHKYLASLPLEYNFFLPLPKNMPSSGEIRVTDKISIVTLNEEAVEEYKMANPQPKTGTGLRGLLAEAIANQGISNLPSAGDTYLRVNCHGYVGSGGSTVYGLDPIYVYKVFFSLNFAMGNLERDNSPRNPSVDRFAQFAFRAFTKDKNYASSLTRPDDEAQLINNHMFKKGLPFERLKQTVAFMAPLMSEQPDKVNEKLRNQIVNSLFWYFEMKKTANPNLKTVFFTSVFDSYFEQDDKSKDKARMIAIEGSNTARQQELARTELEALYQERNKVIHGERPLLDYHIEGKRANERERARVEVAMVTFYNKYLSAKLKRFGQSVGIIRI